MVARSSLACGQCIRACMQGCVLGKGIDFLHLVCNPPQQHYTMRLLPVW